MSSKNPSRWGYKGGYASNTDCYNPLWESLLTNQRIKIVDIFSRSWGSIVAAVEKGRAIYSGIQKFVGEPRASHFIYNVGIYQV